MKYLRLRRGVTLPEVAMVSLVFGLMLSGIVGLGVAAGNQWTTGSAKITADNSASLAMQTLVEDVRNGLRASVSTNRKQLTVVMPFEINTAGDFDRLRDGDTVNYYISGTTLYRRIGTLGTPKILGRQLRDVTFAVSGNQISITLSARQSASGQWKETILVSQATLRNEQVD